MSRRRASAAVLLRLAPEELKEVDRCARRVGLNRTDFIRASLAQSVVEVLGLGLRAKAHSD